MFFVFICKYFVTRCRGYFLFLIIWMTVMFVPRLNGYGDSLFVVTAAAHAKSVCKVPKKAGERFNVPSGYRVIGKAVDALKVSV